MVSAGARLILLLQVINDKEGIGSLLSLKICNFSIMKRSIYFLSIPMAVCQWLVIFFLSCVGLSACKTPGFIVTNEGETIEGRLKVVKYEYPAYSNEVGVILEIPLQNNPYTASLQQKEILGSKDFYDLYHTVFFRQKNGSRFREYFPQDIKAFSFEHKGQSYFFYSKNVIYNQWGREKPRPYFLKLISRGKSRFINCIKNTCMKGCMLIILILWWKTKKAIW